MRKRNGTSIYTLLAVFVIMVFTNIMMACSEISAKRQLLEAEALIIEQPDSATAILASMDTTGLSESLKDRQALLFLYTQLVYGNQIPIDSASIVSGDETFSGACDEDEVKWLIVKSAEAKRTGNPVARIELLKDAEFLAIQLDDRVDLGIIYLILSNVYQQGFNGTVSKFYADKSLAIFKELGWSSKMRDAQMSIVGAYCTMRNYKSAFDALKAMEAEVLANANDSYKLYFLDQLARGYDENDGSRKAIEIWHSIYAGKSISSNTLAHWARAYCKVAELDSAYMLIQHAIKLPHNHSDEYLCRNVEHEILEKMGRKHELEEVDSLREIAANGLMADRHLEESSLALNIKYDLATKSAWKEIQTSKQRTIVMISFFVILLLLMIGCVLLYRTRSKRLRVENENILLRLQNIENNLFEKERQHNAVAEKISALFKAPFNTIDQLASTYFECRETGQEQKRIFTEAKLAIEEFRSASSLSKMEEIVNTTNDNLMSHFDEDFPKLSVSQRKLALFLFCGLSLQSISIFQCTDLRNIYVYKSRLKSTILKSDNPRKELYLSYFA